MAIDRKKESQVEEKVVHPKNLLNDLKASEWINRTVSVFVQKGLGKNSKDARIERLHPAPFSFLDIAKFIELFTKSGEVVLDPFCGVGSSLKAALSLGRSGVGIELNPKYVELTNERMRTELEPDLLADVRYQLLDGDVRERVK